MRRWVARSACGRRPTSACRTSSRGVVGFYGYTASRSGPGGFRPAFGSGPSTASRRERIFSSGAASVERCRPHPNACVCPVCDGSGRSGTLEVRLLTAVTSPLRERGFFLREVGRAFRVWQTANWPSPYGYTAHVEEFLLRAGVLRRVSGPHPNPFPSLTTGALQGEGGKRLWRRAARSADGRGSLGT